MQKRLQTELWTQIFFIENYFYLLIKSLFIIDAVYLFISFQFFYSVYYLTLFCLVFDPKLGRFLRRTCQRTCIQNTEDPEGLTPFASTVSPAEYESALTCPGFTDFFFFFRFGLFFWHETRVTRLRAVTLPIINRMNAWHWSQRLQLILLLSLPLLSYIPPKIIWSTWTWKHAYI